MTLLSPTPVTINIEDAFLITNNTDPEVCPIEWQDSEGNWRKWDGVLDLVWVRRHYIIGPGAQRQVPFDVVRLYFGDPRSVVGEPGKFEDFDGKRGDIAKREDEVRRVAGVWGLYDQNIHMMIATLLSESRKREDGMARRIANLETLMASGAPADDEALPKDGPQQ